MQKILLGLLLVIACTNQGCVSDDEPKGPSLQVGADLPQFSVEMNNGTTVSNLTLQGKVGVIVFFNTGCGDCRKELPVIQKLWEKYKDDHRIEVVAIAREERLEEITDYWEKNNLSMPFSPQDSREVYNLFAQSVIPRIYISNQKGTITFTSGDTDMPDFDTLVREISKLFAE